MNTTKRYFGCPDVFTLIVGEEKEELYVPRTILEQIPFFIKALEGNQYKEAKEKVFTFPEDDHETLADLLHLVVTGDVPQIKSQRHSPDSATLDQETRVLKYVKTYVLADKLMVEGIANKLVDQVVEYHRNANVLPEALVILREANLEDGRFYDFLVRDLAVDLRCYMKELGKKRFDMWKLDAEGIQDEVALISSDDMPAILTALLNTMPNPGCQSLGRNLGCSLHTHQLTERCDWG